MPSQRYAFERGGEPRLAVDWSGRWKNVAITLDGQRLGHFTDSRELSAGRRLALPDGSQLEVSLASWPLPELRLLRDGLPLPGSPSDPAQLVWNASQLICVLAGLSFALGLLVAVADIGFLAQLGFGLSSALGSVVFGALGLAARKGSPLALCAATGLFIADGLLLLANVAVAGGAPPVGTLLVRVFFTVPMARAIPAAFALRRAGEPVHRPPPPSAASAAPTASTRAPLPTSVRPRAPHPRSELRFVAPKLEIESDGIAVMAADGTRRRIAFSEVAAVLVRRLPVEAPWNGAVLFEVTPREGSPVRVLPATLVNFAPLPGGAAPSRLENVRRLAHLLAEGAVGVTVDPATRTFTEGKGVPLAFATSAEFAAHDARFA